MKIVKHVVKHVTIENFAVCICVCASVAISFYAENTNFLLVFLAFTVSAVILAYTTYKAKQYAIMRLQLFFVVVNVLAVVKQIT